MSKDNIGHSQSVHRRSLLKGLATAAGASTLAGCSLTNEDAGVDGDGNGSDGNGTDAGNGSQGEAAVGKPGERVPTMTIAYWSDIYTSVFENSLPSIVKNWEELGLSVETVPVALTTQAGNVYNDKRTCNFAFWGHGLAPNRLDPNEWCIRPNLFWAGANGLGTPNNYANCEHTRAAHKQSVATTTDKRREWVNKCIGKESEDIGSIPA